MLENYIYKHLKFKKIMKNESQKDNSKSTYAQKIEEKAQEQHINPSAETDDTIKKWVAQDIKAAIVLLDTIVNDPNIFNAIVVRLREIKTQAEEFVNKNK